MFGLPWLILGAALHPGRAAFGEGDGFGQSTQLMVVTTPGWDAVDGRLQRYQRSHAGEKWRPAGGPIAIVVGTSGMGWGIGVRPPDEPAIRSAADPVKHEGDGRSPAGVFALGSAFGYSPEPLPGLKSAYLHLTPTTECVDDSGSRYYNRLVDRSTATVDWKSSEHMREAGEAYRWGMVIGHNGGVQGAPATVPMPGGGSCVFLHIWARYGGMYGDVGKGTGDRAHLA